MPKIMYKDGKFFIGDAGTEVTARDQIGTILVSELQGCQVDGRQVDPSRAVLGVHVTKRNDNTIRYIRFAWYLLGDDGKLHIDDMSHLLGLPGEVFQPTDGMERMGRKWFLTVDAAIEHIMAQMGRMLSEAKAATAIFDQLKDVRAGEFAKYVQPVRTDQDMPDPAQLIAALVTRLGMLGR